MFAGGSPCRKLGSPLAPLTSNIGVEGRLEWYRVLPLARQYSDTSSDDYRGDCHASLCFLRSRRARAVCARASTRARGQMPGWVDLVRTEGGRRLRRTRWCRRQHETVPRQGGARCARGPRSHLQGQHDVQHARCDRLQGPWRDQQGKSDTLGAADPTPLVLDSVPANTNSHLTSGGCSLT